jgi:hypothetical protein
MKIEIGQRYIWVENDTISIKGELIKSNNSTLSMKWKNGRLTQYTERLILELLNKKEPNLKIDKEYYRDRSLKELGII